MVDIYNLLMESNPFLGIPTDTLILRGITAIAILLVGIVLGKIISYGLKKTSKKLEINKKIRPSFIELFVFVVRWSVYLSFFSYALNYMQISALTTFFIRVLITIPAFVGALIIISVGFAIAVYLRDVIEDAEITGWDLISQIIFYFVLYISGVYALKIALFSLNEATVNWLIIILTAVVASSLGYLFVKKGCKLHKE